MHKFTKKTLAAATAIALLGGGGVAYAYWTTTGAGTGAATNASDNGTIVLYAAYSDDLTPGASETVTYTADNAGTSNLFVGTITPTVTVVPAGCLAVDFTIAPTTSNTMVLAGATGTAVGTGTLAFANTALNQDLCKGAVVTLTLASN